MSRNLVLAVGANLFARLIAFIAVTARTFVYPMKQGSISGNFTMNVYARLV
jgi:hypothetical protein